MVLLPAITQVSEKLVFVLSLKCSINFLKSFIDITSLNIFSTYSWPMLRNLCRPMSKLPSEDTIAEWYDGNVRGLGSSPSWGNFYEKKEVDFMDNLVNKSLVILTSDCTQNHLRKARACAYKSKFLLDFKWSILSKLSNWEIQMHHFYTIAEIRRACGDNKNCTFFNERTLLIYFCLFVP